MTEPETPETKAPLPPAMRERKPWPMWPIMLSVVLFMAVYTYINLEYRKEGKAYEPFQAMMERKNAIIEKNMYDWYGMAVKRAEDQGALDAPLVSTAPEPLANALEAVLPEQLKYSIATKPILVPGPLHIEFPQTFQPGTPLRLRVWLPEGLIDDDRFNLLAFYKEGELYLLATLFADSLEAAKPALDGQPHPLALLLPTDPMEAERIEATFLSEGYVARWAVAPRR